MEIKIVSRWSDKVRLCGKYESIKDCLERNRGADLGGADLRGAYLRGADLRGAYLGDANLGDANLRGACLGDAYLGDANLGDANLRGADLGGAYLRGADLRGADLRGADLRGANLRGADLGGADLRGAYLGGAYLRGADLGDAKNYNMSHDFWMEIIRRQPIKTFTEKEWAIIGQITIHRLCWDAIKKRYGKKIMPIFKKITKAGWNEFEEHYKSLM